MGNSLGQPAKTDKGQLNLYQAMTSFAKTLRRRFWVLLVWSVVGLGLGTAHFLAKEPVYKAKATLEVRFLEGNKALAALNKIKLLLADNHTEQLSGMLALSPDTLRMIDDLDVQPLSEDMDLLKNIEIFQEAEFYREARHSKYKDYIQPIAVDLYFRDEAAVPRFQEALVRYLESNRFAQKEKQLRKEELQTLIASLKKEIAVRDSLRRNYSKGQQQVMVLGEGSQTDAFVRAYEELAHYRKRLAQNQIVEVVQPFIALREPVSPKKWSILMGLVLGLGIALIHTLLLETKQNEVPKKAPSH